MTTSTSPDARSLAHRLTTVGHALHHRLFAQLRESDLHPRTALILSVIDGRLDAPWVRDRISRGGKRLTGLAERGWIARADEGWTLTDQGRAVLDRVDADRSALLAEIPADELSRLSTALDALADALGVDEAASLPRHGLRGAPGRRGFGPGGRGFSPERRGFGPRAHGFGPESPTRLDDGDDARSGGCDRRHGERRDHGRGPGREHGERRHGLDAGHRRGHRAAQRASERGFDAGFLRGRESSASA